MRTFRSVLMLASLLVQGTVPVVGQVVKESAELSMFRSETLGFAMLLPCVPSDMPSQRSDVEQVIGCAETEPMVIIAVDSLRKGDDHDLDRFIKKEVQVDPSPKVSKTSIKGAQGRTLEFSGGEYDVLVLIAVRKEVRYMLTVIRPFGTADAASRRILDSLELL